MSIFNRTAVAAALIGAVSLAGTITFAATPQQDQTAPAQQQQAPPQPDPQKPEPKKPAPPVKAATEPEKPAADPQGRGRQQGRGQEQGRGSQGRGQQQKPQRLPEPQQQARITQQQQQLIQYDSHLDQQQRLGSQRAVQLQQEHRTSQYTFQLQYVAGLHQQQIGVSNYRNYNYNDDPYFYTPAQYRYLRGGRYYETNEYGAGALREAINFGYEEGFAAGQADRQDHWRFGYQDSYAYQDGNYGYRGFYVDRDEYNYYFREGFRRGYTDGYYGRFQYGQHIGNRYSVFGGVLSAILNLQAIR